MRKTGKQALSICLTFSMLAVSMATGSAVAEGKAKLSKKKMTLTVGQKKTIKISGKKAKAKYTFSSSSKARAAVSKKGVVTAKKAGRATITVKEKDKGKVRKLGKVSVVIKNAPVNTPPADEPQAPASASIPTSTPGITATPTPAAEVTPSPEPTTPHWIIDADFEDVDKRMRLSNSACAGTVEEFTYSSTAITEGKEVERKAMVALPHNYDPNKKYPVIYALHGWNCWYKSMIDDGAPTIQWNARQAKKARDVILVSPAVCANESGTQEVAAYDNFINDLIDCLMPAIEKNYPILTGRENTAIWGFSMGGRVSLLIGFARPDLFGYMAGMCGAPGINNEKFPDEQFMLPDEYMNNTFIMTVKGASDGAGPRDFHEILEKIGVPSLYYETNGFGSGAHNSLTFLHGYYNFLIRAFPYVEEN